MHLVPLSRLHNVLFIYLSVTSVVWVMSGMQRAIFTCVEVHRQKASSNYKHYSKERNTAVPNKISWHYSMLSRNATTNLTALLMKCCVFKILTCTEQIRERERECVWNGYRTCSVKRSLLGFFWLVLYINIQAWLWGFQVKLHIFQVSFVPQFPKETYWYKENNTKYRSLTWKPQSHVTILI